MKKLLLLILLTACNGDLTSTHEVRYSPDGKDSVVHMQYYDGKQYNVVYMVPEQFDHLYDEGGHEGVYDYYISHQLPEYWLRKYKTYEKR